MSVTISEELLALAREQDDEALAHKAMGDLQEAANATIRADALRLATKPADEVIRDALREARRNHNIPIHEGDLGILTRAIVTALSTTGTPKPERDKSYLPFWGTSEP